MTHKLDTSVSDWTILKVIQWAEPYFERHGIEFPRLNIEYFLARLFNYQRIDLYMNYDQPLTYAELSGIKHMVKERIQGRPMQYIVGEVAFYNVVLKVNENVLIPRPETELIVEHVLEKLATYDAGATPVILDLGTGSGNIAISLVKNLDNVKMYACDVSDKALAIAEENARLNDVGDKIHFFKADILKDWNRKSDLHFDYIVSNPPYIPFKDEATLPKDVVDFEPHVSLFAPDDGTIFHHRIITYFGQWLKNNGQIFLELGIGQVNKVKTMLLDNGYSDISIVVDYHDIQRMIYAKKLSVTDNG